MKGSQTIGTFLELGSTQAVECLGRTGLDYIVIDTEHNCYSAESVGAYIRAAENTGLLPYVRIGDIRRPYVLRMLDLGARGLIVPNITSADQVRELVTYAKFPPVGRRGYCPNRTTGWGQDAWARDVRSYMAECNRRCKLIPQCETREALDEVEEIAALEGVDGIFVGPCDLSIALGIPLAFDDPVLLDAIERVRLACAANGKEALIFASGPEDARRWLERGFDSVTCGLDAAVLAQSYQGLVSACRPEGGPLRG